MGPEGATPFPREQPVNGRQTFTGHWSTRNHSQPWSRVNKRKLARVSLYWPLCNAHGCIGPATAGSRRSRGSNFAATSFLFPTEETEFTAFYLPCVRSPRGGNLRQLVRRQASRWMFEVELIELRDLSPSARKIIKVVFLFVSVCSCWLRRVCNGGNWLFMAVRRSRRHCTSNEKKLHVLVV